MAFKQKHISTLGRLLLILIEVSSSSQCQGVSVRLKPMLAEGYVVPNNTAKMRSTTIPSSYTTVQQVLTLQSRIKRPKPGSQYDADPSIALHYTSYCEHTCGNANECCVKMNIMARPNAGIDSSSNRASQHCISQINAKLR